MPAKPNQRPGDVPAAGQLEEEYRPWSAWTSQRRFYVTPEMLAVKWGTNGGHPDCGLCGHVFIDGDVARGQVIPSGAPNIFVCHSCDGPDVVERFVRYWNDVVRPIIRRWADA
jgi:hypothetical protein